MVAFMRTAHESATGILVETEDGRHTRALLYLILVGVLRDESLNILMTALGNHGREAWCRLATHHELATGSLFRGLLRELLRLTTEGFLQSVGRHQ